MCVWKSIARAAMSWKAEPIQVYSEEKGKQERRVPAHTHTHQNTIVNDIRKHKAIQRDLPKPK